MMSVVRLYGWKWRKPMAPVYNLRGQRLTAPQKGINIVGAKKVVVK